MWYEYSRYPKYVSVAERQSKARKEAARLAKSGKKMSPIVIEGSKIAETFWGKAWCDHLESYSDYSNRLPRGRSYVRNGLVVDLQIEPGRVRAKVSGSDLYSIDIKIQPMPKAHWADIRAGVAGQIKSVIELLQGKLSDGVMAVITHRETGMFPSPKQIEMECSCPDSAGLCKHLAAVLYGLGSRLDKQPELLFTLRHVDHLELAPTADTVERLTQSDSSGRKTLHSDELGDVFGVELDSASIAPTPVKAAGKGQKSAGSAKPSAKGTAKKPSAVAKTRAKTTPVAAAKTKASTGKTAKVVAKRAGKNAKPTKPGKTPTIAPF